MARSPLQDSTARWFFLVLGTVVLFLFFKIIEPFIIVIAAAGIAAVVTSPIEEWLEKYLKRPHLAAFLLIFVLFLLFAGPFAAAATVMVQQAIDLANQTVANPDWVANFKVQEQPMFAALPGFAREYLLGLDIPLVIRSIATWASSNIGQVFSTSVALGFKTFIFFVCLYFFLVERKRILHEMLALSPLKDSVDRNIVIRMVETIRGVVLGSLIVACVQGVIAAVGLTLFGVPGALIWAGLVVIAAQVPMLGTGVVMMPAVGFLFLTGHVPQAIGLLLWSVVAVGLVDNILQPYIVGGRTKMHALLILLSMLGGIQYFGPVGFILGPTILAALLVILEIYKAGVLEQRNIGD